jgi:hypothetical protein
VSNLPLEPCPSPLAFSLVFGEGLVVLPYRALDLDPPM